MSILVPESIQFVASMSRAGFEMRGADLGVAMLPDRSLTLVVREYENDVGTRSGEFAGLGDR